MASSSTTRAGLAHGAQPAARAVTASVTQRTLFGALDVVIGLHPLWAIVVVVALA